MECHNRASARLLYVVAFTFAEPIAESMLDLDISYRLPRAGWCHCTFGITIIGGNHLPIPFKFGHRIACGPVKKYAPLLSC